MKLVNCKGFQARVSWSLWCCPHTRREQGWEKLGIAFVRYAVTYTTSELSASTIKAREHESFFILLRQSSHRLKKITRRSFLSELLAARNSVRKTKQPFFNYDFQEIITLLTAEKSSHCSLDVNMWFKFKNMHNTSPIFRFEEHIAWLNASGIHV